LPFALSQADGDLTIARRIFSSIGVAGCQTPPPTVEPPGSM
jgi:hypothetical protein